MAKEQMAITEKEWTKSCAARSIMECQKQLIELQQDYFGIVGTLQDGKYNRAADTIRNLVSDIKNHNLILQALLLEFDGGIPVSEEGVAKALRDLRDAMKDVTEE